MKQRINLRSPFFIQHTSRPAEDSATNSYLHSSDFSNAVYTRSYTLVSSNVDTAPNGELEADRMIPSAVTTNSKHIQQNINTGSGQYTFSIYLKSDEEPLISVVLAQNFGSYSAWGIAVFNIYEGTVVSNTKGSASIEDAYNGWYRISITGNVASSGNQYAKVRLGDGSTNSSEGVLLWGGQLEAGRLSSYIATTSAAVLRPTTSTAQELPVSADVTVWSGSMGYPYDRIQYAENNISMPYPSLGAGDAVTLTEGFAQGPDGTFTANRLQADNLGSGYSLLNLDRPTPTGTNPEYVASIYVKSNTTSEQNFAFYGKNTENYGPRVFTATSEWQRFYVPSQASGSVNFAYIGTSQTLGSDNSVDLLIWGYQYERGTHQVTDFMINETSSPVTVEAYTSIDEPTEVSYGLSNDPVNGTTTFEVGELIRDYIDQSSVKSSGSVWVKIKLSDGLQINRTYTFLATEGYITNFENIQTYLNAPSSEALMQSNSNVIIPEGETLSIPFYAKYNSYYTKTTLGTTIAATYFTDLNDNSSQIEYIDVTSDDTIVEVYTGGSLIHTITIEVADCSKFANNKLMFVNRFGAKQEFFVNMKSIEKIRVKDSGFNRNVIDYNSLSINNGVHGYKRNVTETKETYTLNSPFLDEGNVQAFEELLLSEYVWMSKDGADYLPVVIKDNSMTRKTHLNDKLIQYTVNVESSFNLINNQR